MTVMQGIEKEPALDDGDFEEEEYHFWCCNPDVALCGVDISGMEIVDMDMEDEVLCLFCRYIVDEGLPCPLCHSSMWRDQPSR